MGCTQDPLVFSARVPREKKGLRGCARFFFPRGPPLEKTRRSLARPIKTPDLRTHIYLLLHRGEAL